MNNALELHLVDWFRHATFCQSASGVCVRCTHSLFSPFAFSIHFIRHSFSSLWCVCVCICVMLDTMLRKEDDDMYNCVKRMRRGLGRKKRARTPFRRVPTQPVRFAEPSVPLLSDRRTTRHSLYSRRRIKREKTQHSRLSAYSKTLLVSFVLSTTTTTTS